MTLALFLLLWPCPQDEIQERVNRLGETWGTRWYAFVSGEHKIGFGRFTTRAGDDAVEIDDEYRLIFRAPERRVHLKMRCSRDEHLTPLSIQVDSPQGSYELTFKDGRACATIAGKARAVEAPRETVTMHSAARLACVLPREAGTERTLKYLNLETLQVGDTRLLCKGEQEMAGASGRFTGVLYRLANATPVDLWVSNGVLAGLETPPLAGAVLQPDGRTAADGYNPAWLTCAVNLETLVRLQHEVARSQKRFNDATGRRFWLALTQTKPPLVPKEQESLLVCPSSGVTPALDACTYRGPKVDVNRLGREAIVGCDDPLNHPDGIHVVTLGGQVRWVKINAPDYQRFLDITQE
ncbi:MAG: hypothetical protein HYY16_12225 [Planctomycetes bacterium]|nr:hypothetical protein [Planctomycetota bacterium]